MHDHISIEINYESLQNTVINEFFKEFFFSHYYVLAYMNQIKNLLILKSIQKLF